MQKLMLQSYLDNDCVGSVSAIAHYYDYCYTLVLYRNGTVGSSSAAGILFLQRYAFHTLSKNNYSGANFIHSSRHFV